MPLGELDKPGWLETKRYILVYVDNVNIEGRSVHIIKKNTDN
jgi:hypothetical protein